MKKKFILFLVLSTVIVQSCFEDKGHYDYSELGEITIEKFAENYNATSMVTVLDVPTKITSTMKGDESDYEYMWGIQNTDGYKEIDTISHDKNLKKLIVAAPGLYKLVFCVKNTKLNLLKYQSTNLTVVTNFSDGWYVLKEQENKTDLNLHLSDNSVAVDLITKTRGYPLEGEALSLGFFPSHGWIDYGPPVITHRNKKVFIPMTKKEAAIYEVNTMKQLLDYEHIFYEIKSETPLFSFYCNEVQSRGFVTTGGLYSINKLSPPGSGKFSKPIALDGEIIKPSMHRGMGPQFMLLFDENNSRFLRWDYSQKYVILDDKLADGKLGIMSPNKMNSDLLCMRSASPINTSATVYALMRKKDVTKECYLLTLKSGHGASYNPIQELKSIDKSLKVNDATIFASNYDVPFIYFIANNNLCYYNCETNSETLNIQSFGNENVEFIKHLIYKQSADIDNNFNYLLIGTESGNKYKIYLYNTLAGRPDGEPVRILEGDGKAVDAHFVASKMVGGADYTII